MKWVGTLCLVSDTCQAPVSGNGSFSKNYYYVLDLDLNM